MINGSIFQKKYQITHITGRNVPRIVFLCMSQWGQSFFLVAFMASKFLGRYGNVLLQKLKNYIAKTQVNKKVRLSKIISD